MAGGGTTEPSGTEEVWRVGAAAQYLNAGGVDFGITPRKVRRWAGDPNRLIKGTSSGRYAWRWVTAASVRAQRVRLLADLGRHDPALDGRPQGQGGDSVA